MTPELKSALEANRRILRECEQAAAVIFKAALRKICDDNLAEIKRLSIQPPNTPST